MSGRGAVELFSQFTSRLIDAAPKLARKNREIREEIRLVVEEIADELRRGLELIILRLEGAKNIAQPAELSAYLLESREKLFQLHSEFKICRGLRGLQDRFKRMFDSTRLGVEAGREGEIKALLGELELDERLIIDELEDFWPRLQKRAGTLKTSEDRARLLAFLDEEIEGLEDRKRRVKKLGRRVIERM
jgi:hypothetical protein